MQLEKAGAWRKPAFSICGKRDDGSGAPFAIIFIAIWEEVEEWRLDLRFLGQAQKNVLGF
jgi:hypothetical protein